MASPSASEMSPRCSIVRYAMHRRASSAYGPTNACVGHASRHAVQVPHRSGSRASHSSSAVVRSEEHTSELQSRLHLVCRLLLEKKKKPKMITSSPWRAADA